MHTITRLDEVRTELWVIALCAVMFYLYSLDYRARGGVLFTDGYDVEQDMYFIGGALVWLIVSLACVGFALAWGWLDFKEIVGEMRWIYTGMLALMWFVTMLTVGAVLSVWLTPLALGYRGVPLHVMTAAGVSLGVYQHFYPMEIMILWRVRLIILTALLVGNIAIQYCYWL